MLAVYPALSTIRIVIRLFGFLVWRVHFVDIGSRSLPNIGYRLDLGTGKHYLANLG